jgi:N-hydroxyarylamine O-acetyltransferase
MWMDIDAYLRRIAYRGSPTPSPETLRDLHVAHLRAVPFENLSIHLGEPIVLDDDALFGKIVARRRGGFCYELNGLFAALLRALGFEVSMLSAGVTNPAGRFGPEFDHMTLLVRCPDPWLADVGFGDGFLEPLRLHAGEEQPEGWRLSARRGRWLLSRALEGGAPRPRYRFTTIPRAYADYARMCAFHQRSPKSPFTRQRLCTIATAEGRVTLTGMRLLTSHGSSRAERVLADEVEWTEVLRETFGIVLPHRPGSGPVSGAPESFSPLRGSPEQGRGQT